MKLNLEMKATWPITDDDLIASPKKLSALGSLHESLVSYLESTVCIYRSSSDPMTALVYCALENFTTRERCYSGCSQRKPIIAPTIDTRNGLVSCYRLQCQRQSLPSYFRRFDGFIEYFQSMADVALFTLRCELRLRVLHGLDRMSTQVSSPLAEWLMRDS